MTFRQQDIARMGGERGRGRYRRMHVRDDAIINYCCHVGLFSSNFLIIDVVSSWCLQLSRISLKSYALSSPPDV